MKQFQLHKSLTDLKVTKANTESIPNFAINNISLSTEKKYLESKQVF